MAKRKEENTVSLDFPKLHNRRDSGKVLLYASNSKLITQQTYAVLSPQSDSSLITYTLASAFITFILSVRHGLKRLP